jgi:hypothetical protein
VVMGVDTAQVAVGHVIAHVGNGVEELQTATSFIMTS